jgi:hypothetical protein
MSEPFIVSIHIPKTAGTTLGDVFSRCLYRRVFYDYEGYQQPIAHPDISQHREFITSHFDVLHGHFVAEKYLNVFPEAKFVATLRHPVERTISQYNHELNEISSAAWYHDDVVSGRMDVVTFAAQDGVRNALSQHLRRRALAEYDLLMISENLDLSVQLFIRDVRFLDLDYAYGVPSALPKLNETRQRQTLEAFNSDIRNAIFEKTREDNELYREAQALLLEKSRTL